MARRIFIEPNMLLNPSLRVMPTLYKTLWLYLLTSCDEVGVWVVDWEMAGLACGGKIDPDEAARLFLTTEDLSAKPKAIPIHGGRRWFIRSYLDFQYSKGILNNSQWAKSLQKMLEKHGIDFETLEPISNPLPNPLSNPLQKGIGQDRIGQDRIEIVVSTALSYQGGAGGNGNHLQSLDHLTVTGAMHRMITQYGATGRQPNKTSIGNAIRDAVTFCMKEQPDIFPTATDAIEFLEVQAGKAKEFDLRAQNYNRKGLERWLNERCFSDDIDLAEVAPSGKKESWKDKVEGF